MHSQRRCFFHTTILRRCLTYGYVRRGRETGILTSKSFEVTARGHRIANNSLSFLFSYRKLRKKNRDQSSDGIWVWKQFRVILHV